ncbi:LamG-like jellyroll fold domain-containing protein [uncultured Thiothrix sp.]|uniref:LamG-like jellyroll fold domain-containing protein n=1 Tax=uncultured Thiothrix sp. TaxID=223185 RepID=UPI0026301ACE|nr:LamG-like jellyroll fold domain-containing protein [uncultured Thiothrix sp.]HRJ94743.1 hypothetical protein [Candidatus Thiothrix moscowensis]
MALLYGKFDSSAYYKANPDVQRAGMNAAQHWGLYGISEGRKGFIIGESLGGLFDANGYLAANPDVRNAPMDARIHYQQFGYSEDREVCLFVDAAIEQSGTWLHIANEGQSFTVEGAKTVRFGAATQWVVKDVSGTGQCSKDFFGIDPVPGIAKICQVLVSGSDSGVKWSRLGAEGEKITVPGTRWVRYGAGNRWIVKLLAGEFTCANTFWGADPAPNVLKTCEMLEPEASGSWQRVAGEGERFAIIGVQTLRYGFGNQWITKVLGGVGQASTTVFGYDPAPNILKICEVWTPALDSSPTLVLDFDGVDDCVEIANASLPTGNSNYTIEAWIKPDSMGAKGIIGWGNYGSANQVNALRLTNDGIVNYWWGNDLEVKTGSLVGQWHHVAVVYDGNTRRIYLDGVSKGEDFPRNHNVPTASNATVGLTWRNEYFDGNIAEIRVWNIARTHKEIPDNMHHRLIGNEPGLVKYLRLNNRGMSITMPGSLAATDRIRGAVWDQASDNLNFVIDPMFYYRLTNFWQGDGQSMHIANDGRNNKPVMAGTSDYASQYWKLTPLSGGYYRLTNRWLGASKALDIIDDDQDNKPVMVNVADLQGQFWKLTPLQSGYYRLTTMWQGDGKSLDVMDDGHGNKFPVLMQTGSMSGQFWRLTRTDVVVGAQDGSNAAVAATSNGVACNAQAEGCLAQGCGAKADTCRSQACIAQAEGCVAQGCGAQASACTAQGCIAQASGCVADGCGAQVQGCAGQGCIAQATGCAAQGCGAQAAGFAGSGCVAQAAGCAVAACGAQAQACAGQGCAGNAGGCAVAVCPAQAVACAGQGCAGAAGCVIEATLAGACAAQGCAGQASLIDLHKVVPCAADGQLGPCAVDFPYCPFVL